MRQHRERKTDRRYNAKTRMAYTERLGEVICERLVNGESLNKICKCREMPKIATVLEWLQKHPEFAAKYALAREMQADALADEIQTLADELGKACTKEKKDAIQVRIDARKWLASKLKPRKYGVHQQQTLNAGEGTSLGVVLVLPDNGTAYAPEEPAEGTEATESQKGD